MLHDTQAPFLSVPLLYPPFHIFPSFFCHVCLSLYQSIILTISYHPKAFLSFPLSLTHSLQNLPPLYLSICLSPANSSFSLSPSLCITPISSRSLPSSFFYPFMLHHLSYFQTQIYETNHSAPSLSLPLFLSLSITPPLISVNR